MSNTSERTSVFLIEDWTHDIRHVVFLDNHSKCFTEVDVNLWPLIPVEKTSVDVTTGAHFLIPFFCRWAVFSFFVVGADDRQCLSSPGDRSPNCQNNPKFTSVMRGGQLRRRVSIHRRLPGFLTCISINELFWCCYWKIYRQESSSSGQTQGS